MEFYLQSSRTLSHLERPGLCCSSHVRTDFVTVIYSPALVGFFHFLCSNFSGYFVIVQIFIKCLPACQLVL